MTDQSIPPVAGTAEFDSIEGDFLGHNPRYCGEHRTVGDHRAWCYDCGEWCYPRVERACAGCERPHLVPLPTVEQIRDAIRDELGKAEFPYEDGITLRDADAAAEAVLDLLKGDTDESA